MTFKEYQIEAERTCALLGDLRLDLSHMILGILSEEEEVIKAFSNDDNVNIVEECVDKIWYMANYCTFRNFDLQELYNKRSEFKQESWEEPFDLNSIHFSRLADIVKKYVVYGKSLNRDIEKNCIKALLNNLEIGIKDLIPDFDFGKALQNNIDKLRVRFPEKFTKENALNRNLEQERIELEK